MKRLLIAIALTCALSSAAFAGDIPSVGIPAPVGPTMTAKPGGIPTDGKADAISSGALSVALSVLSFLAR